MLSRENAKLAAVAAVTLAVAWVAPAAAAAAYDAVNADKVDGKHAVGAGATIHARKGKLVATSTTTGRLPNNIIAKAPDADRLDGINSTAYHFIDFNLTGAYMNQGAHVVPGYPFFGITMPEADTPSVGLSFVVPPDYRGTPLKLHVQWHTNETGCAVLFKPLSVTVTHSGQYYNYDVDGLRGLTRPAAVAAPSAQDNATQTVFTFQSPNSAKRLRALDNIGFAFFRDSPNDTCGTDPIITGVWITY